MRAAAAEATATCSAWTSIWSLAMISNEALLTRSRGFFPESRRAGFLSSSLYLFTSTRAVLRRSACDDAFFWPLLPSTCLPVVFAAAFLWLDEPSALPTPAAKEREKSERNGVQRTCSGASDGQRRRARRRMCDAAGGDVTARGRRSLATGLIDNTGRCIADGVTYRDLPSSGGHPCPQARRRDRLPVP